MTDQPTTAEQMSLAIRGMAKHSAGAYATDRTGWTREQWIADAEALMGDIDGSIMSLLNGHVMALLDEVRDLRAAIGGGPC